jgi:hypothetical protein
MLSFVTSQTIALSQVKREPRRPAEPAQGNVVPQSRRRKSLFATVFDALFESRMRKAELEIEAHNRMYPNGFNK